MSKLFNIFAVLFFFFTLTQCSNIKKEKTIAVDTTEKDRLKANDPKPNNNMPEQAVIIEFKYGIQGLDSLFELEERLEKIISEKKVGEYDGNEIAVDYSDGMLFMYGPNADQLFEAIKPILEQTAFMKGAKIKLRYGPPEDGVKEKTVNL